MRCSLLVLSSYLDGELPAERAAEVEAHLVGCSRCSTALGYLREESQRVAGLTRVHVDERAAHQVLALVGLAGQEEEEDIPPPRSSWHSDSPDQPDAPPWLGSGTGRALPWAPRPEPIPAEYEPPVMEYSEPFDDRGAGAPTTPVESAFAEAARQPEPPAIVAEHPAGFEQEELFDAADDAYDEPAAAYDEPVAEPGNRSERPIPDEAGIEVPGMAFGGVEPPHPPIAGTPPVPAPPPIRAEPAGVSRLINRVRDSVSVRLALMRGTPHEMDDSVQIVSGAGAPSWQGRPVNHSYMQRMERRRSSVPPVMPAASADPSAAPDIDEEREAAGRVMPHGVASSPAAVPPPMPTTAVATAVAPAAVGVDAPTGERAGPLVTAQSSQTSSTDVPPLDDDLLVPPMRPQQPGRHMRSVARGQGGDGGRFSSFGQLSSAVVHRTGSRRGPAVGVAGIDRRLWVFASAVTVLLVIGVLVGKASNPAQNTGAPTHPSAAATLSPSHTSAAPTATPAPTPTATPAPAGPQQLTDQVTLGTGAGGFQIAGIRYSAHGPQGGYRLVFDISGRASGAPTAVMGFGTPTTFYVEFSGATAAGLPTGPAAGGVVTAVKLLQPSPIPGKTIYQFTLSKNLSFVANYLDGPRLVIDLK